MTGASRSGMVLQLSIGWLKSNEEIFSMVILEDTAAILRFRPGQSQQLLLNTQPQEIRLRHPCQQMKCRCWLPAGPLRTKPANWTPARHYALRLRRTLSMRHHEEPDGGSTRQSPKHARKASAAGLAAGAIPRSLRALCPVGPPNRHTLASLMQRQEAHQRQGRAVVSRPPLPPAAPTSLRMPGAPKAPRRRCPCRACGMYVAQNGVGPTMPAPAKQGARTQPGRP